MTETWSDESQLTLDATRCVCFGSLGCAHGIHSSPGRLSPQQPDFGTRLLEVGGFDLSTVVARPQRRLALPPVLPVVDGSPVSRGVYRPVVVAPLDAVRRSIPAAMALSTQLGLPAAVETLVSLFARDRELEVLWTRRGSFVSLLAALRPSAVLVPSYSTWSGDPWTEHRYAMKRSFEFLRILQDQGLVAIPHLAWGRRVDAEDLADWLNRNIPDIVAVDAQCLGPLFNPWLRELVWLRKQLDRPPVLLVGGVQPGLRLRGIAQVWPEASFVYNGLRLAASHQEMRFGSDGRAHRVRHAPPATPDRPHLPLGLAVDEQPPAVLYRRSIREFERAVAMLGLATPTSPRSSGHRAHDARLAGVRDGVTSHAGRRAAD